MFGIFLNDIWTYFILAALSPGLFFDSFKLLTAIKESDSIGDGVAGEKSATKVDWQLVGH